MSSRPYGLLAALLGVAMASAGGCAAVAQRQPGSAASAPSATTTADGLLTLNGPNEGSFLLRPVLTPPAQCSPDGGARVDIWCVPLPPGALARLGRRWDGTKLRSSSSSGDAATDEPYAGSHSESIASIALSSDGKLAATTAWDGLLLWEARTGRPLLRLVSPPGCENRDLVATFSADNRWIVAAGSCALRRYDILERRSVAPIPYGVVGDQAAAAREDEVAAGDGGEASSDGGADAGLPLCDAALAIDIAPAGDLAVVTTSQGLLRRFSLAEGRELPPVHLTEPGPYGFTTGLSRPVISSDGSLVAVGSSGELFLVSAATGEARLRVLPGGEGLADLAFAPTASHLAVLTHERLAIVDVAAGKLLHHTPLERYIHVSGAVRYSADGNRIYVLANRRLSAHDGATAARVAELLRSVDDGAYGLFAMAANGVWLHPDTRNRMMVRQLSPSR